MSAQMKQSSRLHSELFWPRIVVRKWLNISDKDSNFSADTDDDNDTDTDSENEEAFQRGRPSRFRDNTENNDDKVDCNAPRKSHGSRISSFEKRNSDALPRIRRRKSETFRAQYISTKEIRIRVGTWNVGGRTPPEDLDIDDWIDINDPADIYVLGLQEIVPLNAGNIFGAEDNRPVILWENIIRDTLNKIRPKSTKIKSFSDPPSPSKYKPSEDIPDIEEEILLESDSDIDEEINDIGEEVHPFNCELNYDEGKKRDNTGENVNIDSGDLIDDTAKSGTFAMEELNRKFLSSKRLDRLNCIREEENSSGEQVSRAQPIAKLSRMLSGSERIGLSWPEPSLNLLSQRVLERPNSFKSVKSLRATKSFKTFNSFKSNGNDVPPEIALLAEIDLESLMKRKRRSSYVRIVSKQMVGVFLTIWVRRSLRRHIQNLKVSTVGVGVMGYIGNKGAISVSMSIYQTMFCFICSHLTSGEREIDKLKRNADVQEIHRRTHFHPISSNLPKRIHDHEKMIWLGDLNYRLNLSYEKARELISKKRWSELVESDQLFRELKKGRAFDGWSEGTLNFPPTYKYEMNSEKYSGEDPKAVRRTPAWCDRILSYGKGMRQLNYRRAELKLSDHRPVTATYIAEVEVFSPRKLQKALTFTDAEIENSDIVTDMGIEVGLSCLTFEPDTPNWER